MSVENVHVLYILLCVHVALWMFKLLGVHTYVRVTYSMLLIIGWFYCHKGFTPPLVFKHWVPPSWNEDMAERGHALLWSHMMFYDNPCHKSLVNAEQWIVFFCLPSPVVIRILLVDDTSVCIVLKLALCKPHWSHIHCVYDYSIVLSLCECVQNDLWVTTFLILVAQFSYNIHWNGVLHTSLVLSKVRKYVCKIHYNLLLCLMCDGVD